MARPIEGYGVYGNSKCRASKKSRRPRNVRGGHTCARPAAVPGWPFTGATLPDVEATSAHDVLCNARATHGARRFCECRQLLSARVRGGDGRAQEVSDPRTGAHSLHCTMMDHRSQMLTSPLMVLARTLAAWDLRTPFN